MLNQKVKEYLDNLERNPEALVSSHAEISIAEEIKDILEKSEDYELTGEDIAERIAFYFMENYPNDDSGWGTYYGPVAILPNERGEMIEYPSIKQISQETLEYWSERAGKCRNPILSARYADLVVDFSPKVLNKSADVELSRIAIDSNIKIYERHLLNPIRRKDKVKRALVLAIQINDSQRISKAKNAIIKLEEDVAVNIKPGLWGFAFEWLFLDFSHKVNLSEKEKDNLLNGLEKRLEEVKEDTWLTEKAVSLLAEYYAHQKDEENLMRVLSILENSFKTDSRLNSDALLQTHGYQQIHDIYEKYASRFPESRKASKRLSQEISQLDLDWNKSLKKVSVDLKIDKRDIDGLIKKIFGEGRDDELRTVLTRLAIINLVRKDDMEKMLSDTFNKYPLQFLVNTQVISDDGMPIANLPPLGENRDSHLKHFASQDMQFKSVFLGLAIDELKRRFSAQEIFEHFEESLAFGSENKKCLNRGIVAYWEGDYLVSSHLFNPIIESGFRELMRIGEGIWLVRNDKDGGFRRLTLSNFLWDERNTKVLENMFSDFASDALFYFRLVLIDKIGMNLRNDFAHGLSKSKFLTRSASDRLFHIMVLLSLVRREGE